MTFYHFHFIKSGETKSDYYFMKKFEELKAKPQMLRTSQKNQKKKTFPSLRLILHLIFSFVKLSFCLKLQLNFNKRKDSQPLRFTS